MTYPIDIIRDFPLALINYVILTAISSTRPFIPALFSKAIKTEYVSIAVILRILWVISQCPFLYQIYNPDATRLCEILITTLQTPTYITIKTVRNNGGASPTLPISRGCHTRSAIGVEDRLRGYR